MCLTTSTATIIIMKHKIRDCNTLFIICYQHTNSIIARATYKQQLTRQQQQQNQHTNNQSKTSTRATTVPIINVCLAHEQQQQIQHTSNNSKIGHVQNKFKTPATKTKLAGCVVAVLQQLQQSITRPPLVRARDRQSPRG